MKYILKNHQSPGDIVMLTAAVRDLKLSHPEIEIDVDTACPEIWENNPYLTKEGKGVVIKADYPLIHDSNLGQYHFIHGFRLYLEKQLNIRIEQKLDNEYHRLKIKDHKGNIIEDPSFRLKGDIHISDEEKSWIGIHKNKIEKTMALNHWTHQKNEKHI